jgi:hypothetical protein
MAQNVQNNPLGEKQSAPAKVGRQSRPRCIAPLLRGETANTLGRSSLAAQMFFGLEEESYDSNQAKQNAEGIRNTVRGKDSEGDPT